MHPHRDTSQKQKKTEKHLPIFHSHIQAYPSKLGTDIVNHAAVKLTQQNRAKGLVEGAQAPNKLGGRREWRQSGQKHDTATGKGEM
jgi:hypothetical protein